MQLHEDPTVRQRLDEHRERVEREEREWAAARLHESRHRNWLGPDECPGCLDESGLDSPIDNREGDPAFNGAFNRW